MNVKLEVVRFANEDVIATSCSNVHGLIVFEEDTWIFIQNNTTTEDVYPFEGQTTGLDTEKMYHIDTDGNIVGPCSHLGLDHYDDFVEGLEDHNIERRFS